MEEKKTTLIEALARAKIAFGTITRSETADTGKYKYKYATLDQMIEATQAALSAEGIIVYHTMRMDGETKFAMIAAHVRGHGEEIISEVAMPYPVADGRMNPAQALGSLLTYGRRYSYGAALGLAIEDDDDARSQPEARPPAKAPASPSTPPGEIPLSVLLKDCFEAGKITDAERADFFARATVIANAAKAVGKDPELAALRVELSKLVESKKPAVHSDDELMY